MQKRICFFTIIIIIVCCFFLIFFFVSFSHVYQLLLFSSSFSVFPRFDHFFYQHLQNGHPRTAHNRHHLILIIEPHKYLDSIDEFV
jgi:hypothetical protein